jgi:prepilin-type N-terminal cleavage/methylation domain-containing protein
MKKLKAFSLVELAVVILIISVLIAAVAQSSRMIKQSKLKVAQVLTQNSPVNDISNLVAWYESTLGDSFKSTETEEGTTLTAWYDINPQSIIKNHTNSVVGAPQYSIDSVKNLPVVKFNGSSYFNLPNGTVPYGNSNYTVFIVAKTDPTMCACGLLGSGNYGTFNQTNAFRYDSSGSFINYWWSADTATPANSSVTKTFQIFTVTYNNSAGIGRAIYINGNLSVTSTTTSNAATAVNNTIGATNSSASEKLIGSIAEIIIFNRSLKSEERKLIENYLGKKHNITVS